MSESWEIAIVLPLGLAANQLMKIEADLRAINMKALRLTSDADSRLSSRELDAKLERIREALDSIQKLVAEFSVDPAPKSIAARDIHRNDKPRADRDD